MKAHYLLLTICLLFVLAAITVKADIIATYETDGCSECIFEYNTNNGESRWLHKDCGAPCWIADEWITCNGNCNVRWPNWKDPANGGYAPVSYGNGYVIVSVQPGKGGSISSGTDVCHPFTPNGGTTISVPNEVAGIK
ncbi:MAG: hypothetical protein JWQ98_940 [Chlorobi bacterium]|nr:hypothetical protein [Chlorobiota bacterium]